MRTTIIYPIRSAGLLRSRGAKKTNKQITSFIFLQEHIHTRCQALVPRWQTCEANNVPTDAIREGQEGQNLHKRPCPQLHGQVTCTTLLLRGDKINIAKCTDLEGSVGLLCALCGLCRLVLEVGHTLLDGLHGCGRAGGGEHGAGGDTRLGCLCPSLPLLLSLSLCMCVCVCVCVRTHVHVR